MIDFKSPQNEVPFFLLERTLRQIRTAIQTELDEQRINLTSDQWLLLMQIKEGKKVTAKQITERTGKDPASVSRMIDLLVKRKLVKRESNSEDRRSSTLEIAKAGEVLLAKTKNLSATIRRRSTKGISTTELDNWRKTSDKFFENCGGRLV
ncbi:MAG: MarR family winged helix-turn-helix transcriptional regulator [Bacteroidia bacterium]